MSCRASAPGSRRRRAHVEHASRRRRARGRARSRRQQAQVLLRRQRRARLGRVAPARSTHSRNVSRQLARQRAVDLAVDRDDAAERRRPDRSRARAGRRRRRRLLGDRDAARVVVLDDRDGRRARTRRTGAAPRRGRGCCCTRAPCPAAPRRRASDGPPPASSQRVERRLLVRVLAVAQRARQRAPTGAASRGKSASGASGAASAPEVRRDRAVVGGGVRERLARQLEAQRRRAPRPRSGSPRARARSRPDRRPPRRARGSWPPSGSSPDRRCRCSRSPRRTARRAPPSRGTDTGSRPPDRSATMPACCISCAVLRRSAGPRMPPWTRGCSVLTRPSRISGAPVKSLTSRTGTPAACERLGRAAGRQDLEPFLRPGRARARRARSCRRPRSARGPVSNLFGHAYLLSPSARRRRANARPREIVRARMRAAVSIAIETRALRKVYSAPKLKKRRSGGPPPPGSLPVGSTAAARQPDRRARRRSTWRCRPGEFFGLLGPNGAGKTTTIGILTTRVLPTGGQALRRAARTWSRSAVAVRRRIGVVPQRPNPDRGLSVLENLIFHAAYFGFSRAAVAQPRRGAPRAHWASATAPTRASSSSRAGSSSA